MEIFQVPDNELEHLVAPFFRHESIENVPQSERQRKPVMEIREVVELRFAGDKNYAPVFPADAMYRRDGHMVITYAERFAEQYRAFQSGADQIASGTPLEHLAQYGITPAQLSLCRAAKVYSIEALDLLEKPGLNSLGQSANTLKEKARAYLADRARGSDVSAELEAMRAELAALKAGSTVVPDDEFGSLSDTELKDAIEAKTGARPKGNPSRNTLISALRELNEVQAA